MIAILRQFFVTVVLLLIIYLYYRNQNPVPTIHDYVEFDERYFKIERSGPIEQSTDDMLAALKDHVKKVAGST